MFLFPFLSISGCLLFRLRVWKRGSHARWYWRENVLSATLIFRNKKTTRKPRWCCENNWFMLLILPKNSPVPLAKEYLFIYTSCTWHTWKMQTANQTNSQIQQPFFKTSTSATSYFLKFDKSGSRTASQSPTGQANGSSLSQQINVRPVNVQGERQLSPACQKEKG